MLTRGFSSGSPADDGAGVPCSATDVDRLLLIDGSSHSAAIAVPYLPAGKATSHEGDQACSQLSS